MSRLKDKKIIKKSDRVKRRYQRLGRRERNIYQVKKKKNSSTQNPSVAVIIHISTLNSGDFSFQLLKGIDVGTENRRRLLSSKEYSILKNKIAVETELLPPGMVSYLKTLPLPEGTIPIKITLQDIPENNSLIVDGIALEQVH